MADGTCGRGVAHPNIIAVLDLHGRLSLNSSAMHNMERVTKNCLKIAWGHPFGLVSRVINSVRQLRVSES